MTYNVFSGTLNPTKLINLYDVAATSSSTRCEVNLERLEPLCAFNALVDSQKCFAESGRN